MMQKSRLHRWELALLLGLGIAAIAGVWLNGQQSALADKVVRLHVIANSDSEADQTLKYQVRDSILADAFPRLEGESREEALVTLSENLGEIAAVGANTVGGQGYQYPVTVSLEETWFPTKEYTDFALPAGNYTALRVVIGEGGGQNWWCVVFPPLCLGSVTETVDETAYAGGLSQEDISLMTGESGGYVVKFKVLEWWEELKAKLS